MNDTQRDRFDALLEQVLALLPATVHRVLDQTPLIVLDQPTPALLAELGIPPSDSEAIHELCGLHTGVPDTDRSVEESGVVPPDIHLFRLGIVTAAGGPHAPDSSIAEEIRVTVLHEVGHQLGLDEDDLTDLGYD